MSLKGYYDYLMQIKEIPGTNDKVEKLKKFMHDKDAVQILQLMYDDKYHYGIKKMKPFKRTFFTGDNEKIFEFLKKLAEQKGTSDSDKIHLAQLASIDTETHEVVNMIVNKDAKCGFSAKLINKARPDTIFIAPYCRCSTAKNHIHRITFPAFVQEKADGMFANFILDDFEFRTRNWKKVYQLEHIIEKFQTKQFKEKGTFNTVFHGELLVRKNGKVLDRKTGNGILNSCLNGTADPEDAKGVFYTIWDCVTYKGFFNDSCNIPYRARYKHAQKQIKIVGSDLFQFIESKQVDTIEEAREFYKRMRKEGKEGAILKNMDSLWKFHTSPESIKMKNVSEAELKIVDWKPGNPGTKYENQLGAIVCESADGELSVSVGSGFTDEDRKKDWDENIGRVVSVEFESVIKDKRSNEHSLFLPRFKELRSDRDAADTLKEIKKR